QFGGADWPTPWKNVESRAPEPSASPTSSAALVGGRIVHWSHTTSVGGLLVSLALMVRPAPLMVGHITSTLMDTFVPPPAITPLWSAPDVRPAHANVPVSCRSFTPSLIFTMLWLAVATVRST